MGEFVIGLTYDLRSQYSSKENEPLDRYVELDTQETINALVSALKSMGYKVLPIGNIFALTEFLARGKRVSLIFNIAEGLWGRNREAQIPALLEAYRIPYTFSDPLTLCLTLDKAMTKRILMAEGIPTAPFVVIEDVREIDYLNLRYPLFVKPVHEGTGMGIDVSCIVSDEVALREKVKYLLATYKQPVLVEKFLKGREFTVGILGTGKEARVLGIMEIIVKEKKFAGIYGVEAKEDCEAYVEYRLAHDLPNHLERDIVIMALKTHRVLNCRDVSRIDIRLDEKGRPHILEVNPLPGLHPTHSDLPILAEKTGLPYKVLISIILKSALERLS